MQGERIVGRIGMEKTKEEEKVKDENKGREKGKIQTERKRNKSKA